MDKNSVIGLLLIGLLVIGYSIYMQPSEQEIAAIKRGRDSVETIQKAAFDSLRKAEAQQQQQQQVTQDSVVVDDATRAENMRQQLDVFAPAAEGTEEIVSVENDLLKVSFSTRGGKVHSVVLKKYKEMGSVLVGSHEMERIPVSP